MGHGRYRKHKARPGFGKLHRAEEKKIKKLEEKRGRARKARDEEVTSSAGRIGHTECGRKARYISEAEARRIAKRRMTLGAPSLIVYHCRHCGGWHLTSHPKQGCTHSERHH